MDATKLKTEQLFDIIANTVYEVYDGETVHKAADYTKEEMKKFIESLTSEHFQKFNNSLILCRDLSMNLKLKTLKQR